MRAHAGERDAHAGAHVGGATDDYGRRVFSVAHGADAQVRKRRVRVQRFDLGRNDTPELLRYRLHRVDLEPCQGKALSQLRRRHRRIDPLPEPAFTHTHAMVLGSII